MDARFIKLKSTALFCAAMFAVFSMPANAVEENPTMEKINRAVFAFNDKVDSVTLKPAAKVYDAVTPSVLNVGVSNAMSNAGEVKNTVNNVLQGKLKNAGINVSRLLINSTVGMGGLFDVASKVGLAPKNEDFSQTLGVWGVKKGPYIVLPLMGPSTVRGVVGKIPDSFLDGLDAIDELSTQDKLAILRVIDARAGLLDAEKMMFGDRYTFIRDFYLNRVDQETLGKTVDEGEDDFVD